MNEPKTYYRRHLPHYQPPGATYHVVFRLAGSLPGALIDQLRLERELAERKLSEAKGERERKRLLREHRWAYFERFDALLDGNSTGPTWLKQPEIAAMVKEAIHYRDQKEYDLLAYCIMPNHVHIVYVGRADCPTYKVLGNLKWYTALKCNQRLHRKGAFWQNESYDHVVRDGKELERIIGYVLNNPVKAGLVQSWEQWPWRYVKPGLL